MTDQDEGGGYAQNCSLRDYFAGQAIQPLIASAFEHNARASGAFNTVEFDEMAAKAYVAADAMLRARK